MSWIKTGSVRKFKHVTINPNTNYNIKNITGVNFEDPQFFYGFEKVIALKSEWSASAILSYHNGNFSINTPSSISNNSILQVLIFEGNEVGANSNTGGFVKTGVIKKTRVVKLDKNNGFSVNLSGVDGSGRWDMSKTKIIPMLGYIKMTKYDLGYDITINRSGYDISVTPKTTKYIGTKRRTEYGTPHQDYIVELSTDCCFYSILIGARSNTTSEDWVGIRFYEDGNLLYETSSARRKTGDTYSYARNKKYGTNKTIRFNSFGNAINTFKAIVDQHIYQEVNLSDCEIYLFLVEED